MAHQINLSDAEMEIVLNAIAACAPSGGGSQQFTLFRKLSEGKAPRDPATVVRYQRTAAQEFFGDDEWMALEDEGRIPSI